jgi:hypothetical protein
MSIALRNQEQVLLGQLLPEFKEMFAGLQEGLQEEHFQLIDKMRQSYESAFAEQEKALQIFQGKVVSLEGDLLSLRVSYTDFQASSKAKETSLKDEISSLQKEFAKWLCWIIPRFASSAPLSLPAAA